MVPLQNRAGRTFPLTVIVESGASLDKLTKFVGQSNADWTNLFSAVDVYLQNGQKVKLDDEKITKRSTPWTVRLRACLTWDGVPASRQYIPSRSRKTERSRL